MNVWPPQAPPLVKGDQVRVLYSRYAGREGEVSFVKRTPARYPFEVTFADGGRAIFESYELEVVK